MLHYIFSTRGIVRKLIGKSRTIGLIKNINAFLRSYVAMWHRLQFEHEWMSGGKSPIWFDHFIDLHGLSEKPNPLWVERGCYSLLVMKPGAKVLDLCSGDGFYTKHFYAPKASSVIAVDYDEEVMAHATRFNGAPNIRYLIADIRDTVPDGVFDNIIWDASIQYFDEVEQKRILLELKKRLAEGGIVSGYTISNPGPAKCVQQHVREFRSAAELEALLRESFANVLVFETVYPERTNLYFFASDGMLPFRKE